MTIRALVRLLAICVAPLLVLPPTPAAAQLTFLDITSPPHCGGGPSDVSPVTTYEWQTLAGSNDPAEVRVILLSTQPFGDDYNRTLFYIRSTPNAPEWSPWMSYQPPDAGTSWTSPSMDYGSYVFAVQGRSALGEAEPIDETRNAVRIRISLRETGPLLTVSGDLIDPIVTFVTTTPPTEIMIDAGTPISFCWTADASAYCGVVTGHRYAWDIADPDDDAQWGEWAPLPPDGACSTPVAFTGGVHMFYVEVIDNAGYKSRVPISAAVLPPLAVETATWGAVKALYR